MNWFHIKVTLITKICDEKPFNMSCFNFLLLHLRRYVMKERCENLTNAQRSQIVWNILTRTGYDNTKKEKVKKNEIKILFYGKKSKMLINTEDD